MRLNKSLLSVFTLMLLFSASLFAQDKEMTSEQWQNEINSLTAKKTALTKEISMLKSQINDLKQQSAGITSAADCQNKLYSTVDATKSSVDNFRQMVDALSSNVDARTKPKKDRQAELDKLNASKMSALPEFYDILHNQLQRKLDAWEVKPEVILYTVVRGDNLWNIAKKPAHYGNGFAWPKIYNANRDQIKNPDLIYPKQIFKIPSLTDAEKTKYEKIKKNYKPAPAER